MLEMFEISPQRMMLETSRQHTITWLPEMISHRKIKCCRTTRREQQTTFVDMEEISDLTMSFCKETGPSGWPLVVDVVRHSQHGLRFRPTRSRMIPIDHLVSCHRLKPLDLLRDLADRNPIKQRVLT